MSPRLRWLVAAAWLLAGPVAAGQSGPKAPDNADCLACHDDHVDTKRFAASAHGPMGCVDCHTDLATQAEFPHAERLSKVNCAGCHDEIASKYHDSIHAWAKEKAGLVVAPGCADCHGKHDILPHTEKESRVFRTTIPDTCGSCHAGIKETFNHGIHAAKLKIGDSRAPSCADCHTAHAIQRADTAKWRLAVTAECGTCHAQVVDSFRRSSTER
jgi:predicted CXXCH cytochrome family protein